MRMTSGVWLSRLDVKARSQRRSLQNSLGSPRRWSPASERREELSDVVEFRGCGVVLDAVGPLRDDDYIPRHVTLARDDAVQ